MKSSMPWFIAAFVAALPLFAADIATTVAFEEQGLPVRISNAASSTDFLFSVVTIKNVGDRTVRSITFGVVLYYAKPNSSMQPLLLTSTRIQTNISPGAEANVHPNVMKFGSLETDLRERALVSVITDLGISKIEFDDGTFWSFEIQPGGGFRPRGELAPLISQMAHPCGPGKTFVAVRYLSQGGGVNPLTFTCDTTTDCTYCQNNGTTCTIVPCSRNAEGVCNTGACSLQTCKYHD